MDYCVSNDVATPDSCQLRVKSRMEPIQAAGPYSAQARTLPNYFHFKKSVESSYATVISDPAIWTSDHPVFYRIEFRDGSIKIAGIRKAEVCHGSLFVDGRRTVLRATPSPITANFADLKLAAVCKCGGTTTEQSLADATRLGIPVILDATEPSCSLAQNSSWPCVMAIILENQQDTPSVEFSENALRMVQISNETDSIPAWAHGAVVPSDLVKPFAERFPTGPFMFAKQSNPAYSDSQRRESSALRRSCERLQCELAPEFSLAGYIT